MRLEEQDARHEQVNEDGSQRRTQDGGSLGRQRGAQLGIVGPLAMTALLVISFIKGRLVALDFMGLRGVKFFWRGLLIGWLLLVSALIALAYWIALK